MNLTKTAGRLTAVILTGVMLAACNGTNPFKGGSNPVKEYPSANEGQPYDPDNKPVTEPPPNNDQFVCLPPMDIRIAGTQDNILMMFTEGQAGVFTATIKNRTGQDFTLTLDGPKGAELKVVTKDLSQATVDIAWTPDKSSSTRVQPKFGKIFFNYKSEKLKAACGDAYVPVTFLTDKTPMDPVVSYANLPQSIAFQVEPIGFQVLVDDPASTQDAAPSIKEIGFTTQGNTGRTNVLDAKRAVSCPDAAQFVEGSKWVFNCTLSLNDVRGLNAEMTKAAIAGFFVTVQSKNNGKISPRGQQATITVTPKTGA